jgi:hypothetical protein
MAQRILGDSEFSQLMKMHIFEILELLMQRGQFFSILTNISNITFEPPLPQEIKSHFKPITLFVVAEYTFESSSIDSDFLYFEAGFGSENIGSLVTVPLSSIVQILIDETPIFINLAIEKPQKKKDESIKKSTNIFLSNPENQNLIKS